MAVVQSFNTHPDELRRTRIDLAAAYRLTAKFDLAEGIDNHLSARVPGTDDRFFINPKGLHWSEITASDILVVDAEGTVVEGTGIPPRSGVCIHLPIHRVHPRGGCVFHLHSPWATALACVEGGRLEMVHQNSVRFFEDVAYDDHFNGLALVQDEGARMAGIYGSKTILFLANHGFVAVAETVAEAWDHLYFLERAAQVQVLAMSTGRPLRTIPEAMARETRNEFGNLANTAAKHFTALKRMLDREGATYAD